MNTVPCWSANYLQSLHATIELTSIFLSVEGLAKLRTPLKITPAAINMTRYFMDNLLERFKIRRYNNANAKSFAIKNFGDLICNG